MSRRLRFAATATILAGSCVGLTETDASAAGFGASWQMNEKTGPAVDSSGNGNDGTLHGGITRTGSGYRFDGSSGYVSVPNSASLNPGSGAITITVKFALNGNPSPSGADYDLVRKGLSTTAGGDYKMEVLSSGAALCLFRGSRSAEVRGGTNLGSGTHTVKCVKTSSSVKLIVDGVTKASKAVSAGSISNTKPVILGAKPGDDWTDGLIDYVTLT
jgi:Concanavalin A-like lectin/glucanases superfamily